MGTPVRQQAAHLLKNMKVISAYMLAVVGGNAKPGVADVKKILSAVSIELDDTEAKALEELIEEMSGKELSEVLEAGHTSKATSCRCWRWRRCRCRGRGGRGGGGGDGSCHQPLR